MIHDVTPQYPPEAGRARIEGAVVLLAVIGKDGSVEDVRVESGLPILAQAAIDAVKQWRYRPYLLNGNRLKSTPGSQSISHCPEVKKCRRYSMCTYDANRYPGAFLKPPMLLLIVLAGGLLLLYPRSHSAVKQQVQRQEHPGTVADINSDPIPECHGSPARAGGQSSHGYNKGRWSVCISRCHAGNCLSDHRYG